MHCARTVLVCIENTHNRCGGAVLSLEYMASLGAWARERARHWLPCRCSACHAAGTSAQWASLSGIMSQCEQRHSLT